ncbi:MAG TPA: hypothetical protein VHU88_04255 [Sporichthyaceae bacterium]|jgi:hypothetical protein|nr:hypothetical protein [Sporichthyaceae bacterium]
MADVETIDAAHSRLQAQADQTLATIRTLSTKLQGAAAGGDTLAREWNLDLREIALAIQAEQQQVGALVQALHDFVVNNAHQPVAAAPYQQQAYQQQAYQQPQYQQPQYQPQPQYQQPQQGGGGGLLGRFMGGSFGNALAQGAGMGIGFGIGESIIDDIF